MVVRSFLALYGNRFLRIRIASAGFMVFLWHFERVWVMMAYDGMMGLG
jgi:hypothetical protein